MSSPTPTSPIFRVVRRTIMLGAVATAASVSAVAQEQATQAETANAPVQEVVVTGTMIKRADFETPSPVQNITAEDIQQAGYTSIAQVLSNLSANGQGTLSQSFNGAFAAGACGIALRGLTVGDTLTLVDGERMVAYPLSDDGQRTFVDTCSIPLVAVDHIDVLKDGASAAYGSDAIAGVVNVVLKKSFTGFQFSAEGGTTIHDDGTNERVSGLAGIGDLASDGYNAYIAFEWRHQDAIGEFSRSGAFETQNWEPQGGANLTAGAGSLFTQYGINPFPNTTGAYLVPASAQSFQSPGVVFLNGCAGAAALAADQCTYNNSHLTLQPPTSNLNVIGRLTANFAGDWQAKVTASFFQSNDSVEGGYSTTPFPGAPFQVPIYYPGFVGVSNPVTLTVPVGNPMNPTNQPLYPVATLFEFGQSQDNVSTDTYRLFTELTGTTGGWDLDLNLGEMYALTTQQFVGDVNFGALQTALNNGYIFGQGLTQLATGPTAAQLAAIDPTFSSDMSDSLQVVDLRGTRQLFTLPGGPLSLALGAGFYHRFLDATQSAAAINSGTGVNLAYAEGGQSDYNAYGEVVAPILSNLELDASGRYDHYSEGGSAAVPKLGLKFTPIKQITFRGTWGEGYRAPNPAENGKAGEAFLFTNASDPILCPSNNTPNQYNLNPVVTPGPNDVATFCNFAPVFLQGTNPDLQPERSRTYTVGFVLKPVSQVNLSVDYWHIDINNIILTNSLFPALPLPPSPVQNVRTSTPTQFTTVDGQTVDDTIPIYSLSEYENAGNLLVEGLDVDLVAHQDLDTFGRLTEQLNYSHMFEYNASACYQGTCETVYLAGTHGPSGVSGDTANPQDRAVLTVAWDRGPVDVTVTVNYVGSYNVTDPSLGYANTCLDSLSNSAFSLRFPNGNFPSQYCNVPSFTYVNLYSSYTVNQHLQVFGSIQNLFNTAPPLDLETYGSAVVPYNPSLAQPGAVGMLFDVGFRLMF